LAREDIDVALVFREEFSSASLLSDGLRELVALADASLTAIVDMVLLLEGIGLLASPRIEPPLILPVADERLDDTRSLEFVSGGGEVSGAVDKVVGGRGEGAGPPSLGVEIGGKGDICRFRSILAASRAPSGSFGSTGSLSSSCALLAGSREFSAVFERPRAASNCRLTEFFRLRDMD
jgi:hypothetical protein